jgi:hypothetical protein
MTKESRRKIKPKTTPTKYVSSDDEIDSSDDEDEDEDEESLLSDMRKKILKQGSRGYWAKWGFEMNFLKNEISCLSKRKKAIKSSRNFWSLKRRSGRSMT